ncbi:hypothetical protein BC629DRAFT_1247841, partial [Irpex lacteus]
QDCKYAKQFIEHLEAATLENDAIDDSTRAALRDAPTGSPDLDCPNLKLSLQLYLATDNASEETYHQVCAAIKQHPKSAAAEIAPLTYSQVKQKVSEITGITPIYTDMCPQRTCVAF